VRATLGLECRARSEECFPGLPAGHSGKDPFVSSSRQAAEFASSVHAFVGAVNDGRLSDVINAFLSNAIVNDQFVEYEGHQAIGAWARNDLLDQHARITVVKVRTRPTGVILTVEMS
jgi:hypothetical protein